MGNTRVSRRVCGKLLLCNKQRLHLPARSGGPGEPRRQAGGGRGGDVQDRNAPAVTPSAGAARHGARRCLPSPCLGRHRCEPAARELRTTARRVCRRYNSCCGWRASPNGAPRLPTRPARGTCAQRSAGASASHVLLRQRFALRCLLSLQTRPRGPYRPSGRCRPAVQGVTKPRGAAALQAIPPTLAALAGEGALACPAAGGERACCIYNGSAGVLLS